MADFSGLFGGNRKRSWQVQFVLDGQQPIALEVYDLPSVGDYVNLGSGSWRVVKKVWTPLSKVRTDVVYELTDAEETK